MMLSCTELLPEELGNLANLEQLNLFGNEFERALSVPTLSNADGTPVSVKLVEQDARFGPWALAGALRHARFDLALRLSNELHVSVEGAMIKSELVKVRGRTTLWHQMVTLQDTAAQTALIPMIAMFAKEFPELLELRDADGRQAYVMGTSQARRAMRVKYFCRRYKLSTTLHKSMTCVVLLANDMEDENERVVVVKLMLNQDQYEREVSVRKRGLADKFVVPILQTSETEGLKEFWVTNVAEQGYPCYDYGIIMEFADRNTDSIMRQERPKLEDVQQLLEMLIDALAHLESHKVIHGDIKLLNIVRVKGMIKLIDMDAVANLDGSGFMGVKFSSGVLPPEMFVVLDGLGVERFKEYWREDFEGRSELWRKIEPRWSNAGDAIVVKAWCVSRQILAA